MCGSNIMLLFLMLMIAIGKALPITNTHHNKGRIKNLLTCPMHVVETSSLLLPPAPFNYTLTNDVILTRSNWAQLLSHICWPHIIEQGYAIDYCSKEHDPFQQPACTLMDRLLSTRHFHPDVGFSGWVKSASSDIFISSSSPQISIKPLQPNDIQTSLMAASFSFFSSSFTIPKHQALGIIGLCLISFLTLFCLLFIHFNTIKKSEAVQQKIGIASIFNFSHHFISIFKKPNSFSDDRFPFLESLRVVSMSWIIFGHSVLYWAAFLPFTQVVNDFIKATANPVNYGIFASVFAVDSFFYVSGLLVGYQVYLFFYRTLYKNIHWKKIKVCFNVMFSLILQRYVRLMGITTLLLFGYMALDWKYMKLPSGSRYLQATNLSCYENLLPILTLTNNVSDGEFVNECFGWTWYLANDFQFFIVGLLLILIAVIQPQIYYTLIIGLLGSSIYITSYLSYKYELSITPNAIGDAWVHVGKFIKNHYYFPLHPIMDYFYVKPWVRIGPYLIGLVLGITLAECKQRTTLKRQEEEKHTTIFKTIFKTKQEKISSSLLIPSSMTTTTQRTTDTSSEEHFTDGHHNDECTKEKVVNMSKYPEVIINSSLHLFENNSNQHAVSYSVMKNNNTTTNRVLNKQQKEETNDYEILHKNDNRIGKIAWDLSKNNNHYISAEGSPCSYYMSDFTTTIIPRPRRVISGSSSRNYHYYSRVNHIIKGSSALTKEKKLTIPPTTSGGPSSPLFFFNTSTSPKTFLQKKCQQRRSQSLPPLHYSSPVCSNHNTTFERFHDLNDHNNTLEFQHDEGNQYNHRQYNTTTYSCSLHLETPSRIRRTLSSHSLISLASVSTVDSSNHHHHHPHNNNTKVTITLPAPIAIEGSGQEEEEEEAKTTLSSSEKKHCAVTPFAKQKEMLMHLSSFCPHTITPANKSKATLNDDDDDDDDNNIDKNALLPSAFDSKELSYPYQWLTKHPLLLIIIMLGTPAAVLLYAHIASRNPHLPWGRKIDALMMGLQRPLWGLSLACWTLLMIFSTSQKGVLFVLLRFFKYVSQCYIWVPISRLSFSIYLIHPIIVFWLYGNGYGPKIFDRGRLLGCSVLVLLLTLFAATTLHVFAECVLKRLIASTLGVFTNNAPRISSTTKNE